MSIAVAEPDDAAPPPVTPAEEPEEIVGYVRSASDVLRLFTFALVAVVLLALARWAQDGLLGIEKDLLGLFGFVSPAAERFIAGVGRFAFGLVTLAVLVPPFLTKRYRLLGYLFTGWVISGIFASGAIHWL